MGYCPPDKKWNVTIIKFYTSVPLLNSDIGTKYHSVIQCANCAASRNRQECLNRASRASKKNKLGEVRKKSEKGPGQKEKTKQDKSEVLGKRQQGCGHPEAHFFSRARINPRISSMVSLYEAIEKVFQRKELLTAKLGSAAELWTVHHKFFNPYDDLFLYWIIFCFLLNGSSKTVGKCRHKTVLKQPCDDFKSSTPEIWQQEPGFICQFNLLPSMHTNYNLVFNCPITVVHGGWVQMVGSVCRLMPNKFLKQQSGCKWQFLTGTGGGIWLFRQTLCSDWKP